MAAREESFSPYGFRVLNPPARVSELITSDDVMGQTSCPSNFLPMDAQVILGIPLCTRNIPDFWAWHYEKHMTFSVKSAYEMMVATAEPREAWLEGSTGPSSARAEESSG